MRHASPAIIVRPPTSQLERPVDDSNGDAGPVQSHGWSRRKFLLASASMALLAACRRSDEPAASTQPSANQTPRRDAAAAGSTAADTEFLALSVALTGKTDLDPSVAGRIRAALASLDPATTAALPALKRVAAATADSPATIVVSPGVRDAALAIIAAWYTGTVGKGTAAVTVAYRDALMQRPVADGLFPATYALSGPAWWVAAPPAAIALR